MYSKIYAGEEILVVGEVRSMVKVKRGRKRSGFVIGVAYRLPGRACWEP